MTDLRILLATVVIVGAIAGKAPAQSSSVLSAHEISSDTGTVVVDGLADKGGQVFNVKAYGAKGDGTTDDTAAIDSALTAAGSVRGTVLFVPGTYKVSTLNVPNGVTLKCSAWLACRLLYSESQTIGVNGGLANYYTASINGIVFDFGNTSNGLIFNDVLHSNSSFQVQNTTGTAFTIEGTCSTPGRPSTCTNKPWPSSSSAFNTFPFIRLKNVGVGLVLNGDDNLVCGGHQQIGGAAFFNHFGTVDVLDVTGAEAVEFTSGADSNTFQSLYMKLDGSATNGLVLGSRCPTNSGDISLNHFNYVSIDRHQPWTGYGIIENYGNGVFDDINGSGTQRQTVFNNGYGSYIATYDGYSPMPGSSQMTTVQGLYDAPSSPATSSANHWGRPIYVCGQEWNGTASQQSCYKLVMGGPASGTPGYDALHIEPFNSATRNNAVVVPKLVVQEPGGNFSIAYAGGGSGTQFLARTANLPGTVNIAEFGGGGAGSISSGKITLSGGGSGLHAFVMPYSTAPVCVATDNTSPAPVKVTSTSTAVSVTGTRSDVVSWICMPAAN